MTTVEIISRSACCLLAFVAGAIYDAENRKRLDRKNYFLLFSIYQHYHPPAELRVALMATAKAFLPPKFVMGLEKQDLSIPEINYLVEFTMNIVKTKMEDRPWWHWEKKREDKLLLHWLETINANHVLAMKF